MAQINAVLSAREAVWAPCATLPASGPPSRVIFDVPVAALDQAAAAHAIMRTLTERGFLRVNFLNANNANIAATRPELTAALKRSLVLADGIGMDLASRLLYGASFPANLNGTDFVPALLEDLASPLTIGLLGGAGTVAAEAAHNFTAMAPQHTFVVIGDGYFSDDAAAVERVRAVKPDILLVAMGTPRQELWADRHIQAGDCAVVITVGALFDFVAGRVSRAPRALRALKLEWLYRLALEPRRLAQRYLVGNAVFLARALVQAVTDHRRQVRPVAPTPSDTSGLIRASNRNAWPRRHRSGCDS